MKNKLFLSLSVLVIFLLFTFFILKYMDDKSVENIPGYNNSIFTKNIEDKIVSINYWNCDKKIEIIQKADIKNIYTELASLKLKKAFPFAPHKEGNTPIEIITTDTTLKVSLLPDTIIYNHKMYYTNKDVLTLISKVINNDIDNK